MTTFLFWNLNKKPLEQEVLELVHEHQVDVLMLAESEIENDAQFLKALNLRNTHLHQYHQTKSLCPRIKLISRVKEEIVREYAKFTIRELHLADKHILLVVAHLPSQMYMDKDEQFTEAQNFSHAIQEAEKQTGHTATILVGDLNMDPYDKAMVMTKGLHAVMTRVIATKKGRKIQKNFYPYFYNPMWNLFGDYTDGPPGTYYYAKSNHKTYFWHMFDQLLLRPDLLPFFRNETLQIVDKIGTKSLLNKQGIPNKNNGSDHLPIIFKLDI